MPTRTQQESHAIGAHRITNASVGFATLPGTGSAIEGNDVLLRPSPNPWNPPPRRSVSQERFVPAAGGSDDDDDISPHRRRFSPGELIAAGVSTQPTPGTR
ncbi:hypothetical protein HPB50_024258 [Hyalomma asiaticum]|uniref:Uncharacterized protein n=1 Tax=Hyalomma asiaticum TaxID=266040 RepID=A0ACB7S8W4_HYAAI|nr:hypothetical protein HPB50_024258 [Hyalomma asiaticum]